MVRIIKFIALAILTCTSALKPNKMPDGKPRKYIKNKDNLSLDLKVINIQEASFISRHWLNNMISVKGTINKEDEHIIDRINKLEKYRQDLMEMQDFNKPLILAWCPEGVYSDVLFIICCKVDTFNKSTCVQLLIQSPFWDSNQIESIYLKESLEYLADASNSTINFQYLYNNDMRYKLAWKYWK